MKTALCLSGQARFGSYAFRNLVHNLLSDADCDVFIFLWRMPGQSEDEARAVADNFVGRYIPIRECFISEQIDFPAKDYATRIYPGANAFNIQSMFYAMKMADQLRLKRERELGFQYDCVIRSRVDLSCFSPVNLEKYLPLMKQYVFVPEVSYFEPGLNDTFAFGSSKNMEVYSNLYDRLDEYFYQDKIQFNPHIMLIHNIVKKNIPFAYLSIPVEIVREVPMPKVFEG